MTVKSKNITVLVLLFVFSILPVVSLINFIRFLEFHEFYDALFWGKSYFNCVMFFVGLLFLSFVVYVFVTASIIKFRFSLSNEMFFVLLFLLFSLFLNLKSILFNFNILSLPSIYYNYAMKTLLGMIIVCGLFLISSSFFSTGINYKNFDLVLVIVFAFLVIFIINIPINTNLIGVEFLPSSILEMLIYVVYSIVVVSSALFFFFSNKIVQLKDKIFISVATVGNGAAIMVMYFSNSFFINMPVTFVMIGLSYFLMKRLHNIYLWGW